MSRSRVYAAMCAVLLSITLGRAQGPHGPGGMMGGDTGRDSAMCMGPMMGCGMMVQFLTPRVNVITDGGVIVVTGTTLQKYDKDLNLKKEIVLKIDTAGIQNIVRQLCPGMFGAQIEQPSRNESQAVPQQGAEQLKKK